MYSRFQGGKSIFFFFHRGIRDKELGKVMNIQVCDLFYLKAKTTTKLQSYNTPPALPLLGEGVKRRGHSFWARIDALNIYGSEIEKEKPVEFLIR